jgi:hypothetical protein
MAKLRKASRSVRRVAPARAFAEMEMARDPRCDDVRHGHAADEEQTGPRFVGKRGPGGIQPFTRGFAGLPPVARRPAGLAGDVDGHEEDSAVVAVAAD